MGCFAYRMFSECFYLATQDSDTPGKTPGTTPGTTPLGITPNHPPLPLPLPLPLPPAPAPVPVPVPATSASVPPSPPRDPEVRTGRMQVTDAIPEDIIAQKKEVPGTKEICCVSGKKELYVISFVDKDKAQTAKHGNS